MDWFRTLMGGTRGRTLALLRRSRLTITELSAVLGITDNAVRAHIAALQRDGMVEEAGQVRTTGGKPAVLYQLTTGGEELFPKAYVRVLAELLRSLEERHGAAEATEVLRHAGVRAARQARPNGGDSAETRVRTAATVLASIGGDMEVARTADGWELRGSGCPLSGVVRDRPDACVLVESLVGELTGLPTREQCDKGERPRCVFRVGHAALALVLAASVAACAGADQTAGPATIRIGDARVIVSTASELLAGPGSLALTQDGRVLVADSRDHRVLMLTTDGALMRSFGGPGEGPGEFRIPAHIGVAGDTLYVLDRGNGRVQRFLLDGTHLDVRSMPPPADLNASAFTSGGAMLVGTRGMGGVLARLYSRDGESLLELGRPRAEAETVFDMAAMRAEARQGRLPWFTRNEVLPVAGPDGFWLVLQGDGSVERYDADGTLLWTVALDSEEVEAARRRFMQAVRDDDRPFFLPALRPARDAFAVGNKLWLLLDTTAEEAAVVLVYHDTGELNARIEIKGVASPGNFALDEGTSVLYLTVPSAAALAAVTVPQTR